MNCTVSGVETVEAGRAEVAYFLTHPIQYQSPLIRRLCAAGIKLHVYYATDATSKPHFDPGYDRQFDWDVPLLDGYPFTVLNTSEPSGNRFALARLFRAQVACLLDAHKPTCVWVHGWNHPFVVAAWRAARDRNLPILLRGETSRRSIRGGKIGRILHRFYYSRRFRHISAFLPLGTLNERLYLSYGVHPQRIFLMPHAVDNAFFQKRASEAHLRRDAVRASLGLDPSSVLILFCGRLAPEKDIFTLINAVGKLNRGNSRSVLLLAGDGLLRQELEALASRVAPGAVTFLGFRNQTELPALYDLCDVFVLPSKFEPWGLVVNEVMNAGKPVIVSDQVGCGPDLVHQGENGGVFRAGDVDDLCAKLRPWLEDRNLRQNGGMCSLAIINHWSFEEDLAGIRAALRFVADKSHARPTA